MSVTNTGSSVKVPDRLSKEKRKLCKIHNSYRVINLNVCGLFVRSSNGEHYLIARGGTIYTVQEKIVRVVSNAGHKQINHFIFYIILPTEFSLPFFLHAHSLWSLN